MRDYPRLIENLKKEPHSLYKRRSMDVSEQNWLIFASQNEKVDLPPWLFFWFQDIVSGFFVGNKEDIKHVIARIAIFSAEHSDANVLKAVIGSCVVHFLSVL